MRATGLLSLVCAVALLVAAATAQAAFPGVPGPIAYPRSVVSELGDPGGIFAHGPRKRDGRIRLTDSTRDATPSYSPNGRLIVFSGNRDAGLLPAGTHIYAMSRDGNDVRQLTSGEFIDSNPSFSPDGRTVVFDRGGFADRTTHLFSVPLAGGTPRQLTVGESNESDPVYAPNGRRIVFVSDRRPSARTDRGNIFSMRPNGSRVRLLIGGARNELDPDVSPNGRAIAFDSNRRRGPNIFVARIDGTHVRALTRSRGDCFRGTCYTNPSWAPDGRHIAFLGAGRYKSVLEVMRTDGRGSAKEFDHGGTEAEGYGTYLGAPGWGSR